MKINTLTGIEDKLTNIRRDGNTTRVIDNAIQLLFKHRAILVEDHTKHHSSNKMVFFMILKRLETEHHLYSNVNLKVDNDKLTIELL